MDIESLRDYVIKKPFVTEGFPFGDNVIVFKVNNKIFLLVPLDTNPLQFNAKCDPERALELREQYPLVSVARISYEQETLEHYYCGRHSI